MFVVVDEVKDGSVYVTIEWAEDPVANNFHSYALNVTVDKRIESLPLFLILISLRAA